MIYLDDAPSLSRASARLWMSEMRHHRESGQWSTIFGVYHDRYQRTDRGWRIAFRQYHSLARLAHPVDEFSVFDFPDGLGDLEKFAAEPE